jgi:hypothetical protein
MSQYVRLRPCFATMLALLILAAPALAADSGFVLRDQPGQHLDVVYAGRVVARYMVAYDTQRWTDTYKPYLHVMDAEGKQPITKGPGGQFPHHRGIFIGYNRLSFDGNNYDLWHMSGGPQVHQEFSDQQAGPDQARFTSLVHWNTKDDRTLLEEQRTFVFHAIESPGLVKVDVISKLKAVSGDVVLGGDPEHAGVQYRPANELDRQQSRYLFPAEDADPKRDRDLAWSALRYVLDGKAYTVVQFNAPSNPQDTVWSAYRDYGRFGAFPRAEIAAGQTLTLAYRFLVTSGDLPDREQIQKWYDQAVRNH